MCAVVNVFVRVRVIVIMVVIVVVIICVVVLRCIVLWLECFRVGLCCVVVFVELM